MRRLLAAPLALLFVASGSPLVGGTGQAAAQERPRTIMDMLFGSPSVRRRPIQEIQPPRRIRTEKAKPSRTKPARSAKSRSQKATGAATAAAAAGAAVAVAATRQEPAVVEKSEAAKSVLVVGDFMAASLAGGLGEAFAANAGLKVENAADGSSGLVRADHLDWVARIGPLIEEKKPALVLVMVGSNDRQPIVAGSMTYTPDSPEWIVEYGRRAEALAAAVEAKGVPLVWVGMPSFKFERMSEDMASFNEVYRKASASVGGDYVDVWDGFVDANGVFSYSGPDIAGQQARLRNEDGITMTPEGAEKLAFFAEKPIFRLLGTGAVAGPSAPGEPLAATMAARPANATSAPLVGFNDPALDGGEALLGGTSPMLASAEPSPRQRLVVTGDPMATPTGRADDFNWNRKTEAVVPLRGTDDVISRGSVGLQTLREQQGPRQPQPMPSLADAIIEDWKQQNAAQAAKADTALPSRPGQLAAPVEPATRPAPVDPQPSAEQSPAAETAPVSASPFERDQKPL